MVEVVEGKKDGNYRPDLKGLRRSGLCLPRLREEGFDGNYRPDLKGLRQNSPFSWPFLSS